MLQALAMFPILAIFLRVLKFRPNLRELDLKRLGSHLSSSLIISLLVHQSPLHDGAIIIQSGRIAAAGCVLPLPEEERGAIRHLGMRHRAAIGITHETDAVSVVVSEETGVISVASAGRLTQNLDEETLAKSLKSMFYKPARKKPRFHITKLKES